MSAPTAAKPEVKPLTYEVLKKAVEGGAAAFRCRRTLQPAGGPGDKVFPPTFAGAVYAIEKRRLPGREEPVTCVLLDSVQSQANRMEQALQDAVDADQIRLPLIEVDFSQALRSGELNEDPGRITSLTVPHRLADAILRDSEYREGDGGLVKFRESSVGRPINDASPRNATAIYQLCPTALVFGMWDSTGPKGGLGAKFERAMVSEIVGLNAAYDEGQRSRGVRRDPLQIVRAVGVVKAADGSWTVAGGEAKKTLRPSEINHGSVPFDNANSGLTIERAEQTVTLSGVVLRRLEFPGAAPEAKTAARCAIAALGIVAATLSGAGGEALRSRCLLWPEGPMVWELLAAPGAEPEKFGTGTGQAIALLATAAAAAAAAGLGWRTERVTLTPGENLSELVRKSQEQLLAATAEG
ncbi:MAG: type I-G CRISPR-associated RAMP protein Csb1/Cas7g [Terriglobales bacterium]